MTPKKKNTACIFLILPATIHTLNDPPSNCCSSFTPLCRLVCCVLSLCFHWDDHFAYKLGFVTAVCFTHFDQLFPRCTPKILSENPALISQATVDRCVEISTFIPHVMIYTSFNSILKRIISVAPARDKNSW